MRNSSSAWEYGTRGDKKSFGEGVVMCVRVGARATGEARNGMTSISSEHVASMCNVGQGTRQNRISRDLVINSLSIFI